MNTHPPLGFLLHQNPKLPPRIVPQLEVMPRGLRAEDGVVTLEGKPVVGVLLVPATNWWDVVDVDLVLAPAAAGVSLRPQQGRQAKNI